MAGAVPFGVYAIVQNFNIPLQIQPQVFCFFSLVSWAQILFYNNGWRVWTGSLFAAAIGILFAGLEVVLVLTLRGPYHRGNNAGMLAMGILASVILAIGLLPPYWEAWKRRGRIIGINWIFISVDFSGGFFSLMALVAQETFDILGGMLYGVCLLLEGGIFVTHILWRIRTRKLRVRAKATGIDFDDMPEAAKYQCDTDRIARNRLKEEEEIKQQEVEANAQISAGQGTAAASSAVTVRVEEPDDAINNEKSVATSISGQASPFRASNAPTEIGIEDSDSAADADPGHPPRKQRSLTIDTTSDNKLHKPVAQHQAVLDEKPDDPTSAVASSFQTANEEVSPSSTTPHDAPDAEHQDRRRGFRRTWVLVQSRGERQAHELRSPSSGHTLRSPASVGQDLRSPASKHSLRSPASVGQGLRNKVSMASVKNAMGLGRRRRPSEPDGGSEAAAGKAHEEAPPLPTPTTPAWMREVEGHSPITPGPHRSEGEYQPPAPPGEHPSTILPSPTTPHSGVEDLPSPRTPQRENGGTTTPPPPETSDSTTPKQ